MFYIYIYKIHDSKNKSYGKKNPFCYDQRRQSVERDGKTLFFYKDLLRQDVIIGDDMMLVSKMIYTLCSDFSVHVSL